MWSLTKTGDLDFMQKLKLNIEVNSPKLGDAPVRR